MDHLTVLDQSGGQRAVIVSGPERLAEPDRLDLPPHHVLIQLDRSLRSARSALDRAHLQGVDHDPLNQAIPQLPESRSLVEEVDADRPAADGDGDSRRSFGTGQVSPQVFDRIAVPLQHVGQVPGLDRTSSRTCFLRIACQSDN